MITPDINKFQNTPLQLKGKYSLNEFKVIINNEVYTLRLEKQLKVLIKGFEATEDFEWCAVIYNYIINKTKKLQ